MPTDPKKLDSLKRQDRLFRFILLYYRITNECIEFCLDIAERIYYYCKRKD